MRWRRWMWRDPSYDAAAVHAAERVAEAERERDALRLDAATLLVRVEQIDREQRPEHWLWDRVMSCDVPRLREQLLDTLLALAES